MNGFAVRGLLSGGVIVNYRCSSRCAHCLYRCSPGRDRAYMDREGALKAFGAVRAGGCNSAHIGGGEPLLDPEALVTVLSAAQECGVSIEYVETNSSWYRDGQGAADLLARFRNLGVRTLLVSISPFHNEYVPLWKIKGVMEACGRSGMDVFPWIGDFFGELDQMGDDRTHGLGEYAALYGRDAVEAIPRRYRLHPGGRAIDFLLDIHGRIEAGAILAQGRGCAELADTTHFHIDLYGGYVPGLCAGLSFPADDIGITLDPDRYPLITALYREGVRGLVKIAREHGFSPAEGYLNKCHLCNDARAFLAGSGTTFAELCPAEYYSHG